MKKKVLLLMSIMLIAFGCFTAYENQYSLKDINIFSNSIKGRDESYKFVTKINGIEYKMPFRFDEVMADDWQIENGKDGIIKGGLVEGISGEVKITNGKDIISVRFQNNGQDDLPYSKCMVGSMIFNKDDISKDSNIVLPKNISLNDSKLKVILLCGIHNYDHERNLVRIGYTDSSWVTYYFEDDGWGIKSVEVVGFFK